MEKTVYIFDADGVLNDLQNYQPDERILSRIANLLDSGTFVAINTGRGYEWVEQNIVRVIRSVLRDPTSLSRLFVAVEMGGLTIQFVDGAEQKTRSAFSLSADQIQQVRDIFDQYPHYHDRIHWYEGKVSMATIDKNDLASLDDFHPVQKELTGVLQELFKDQHVRVSNSNDAIDVQAPEAGKWAGAQLIYDWLGRVTDVQHDHFVCFGDSIVDYEMARFFAEQSHDTVMVFTGLASLENVQMHPDIRLYKTEQPYREGTFAYLQNNV